MDVNPDSNSLFVITFLVIIAYFTAFLIFYRIVYLVYLKLWFYILYRVAKVVSCYTNANTVTTYLVKIELRSDVLVSVLPYNIDYARDNIIFVKIQGCQDSTAGWREILFVRFLPPMQWR